MGMRKHDAQPIADTVIRETDRIPVDGNFPADYPLLGRCESCHREIRIESAIASGWKHTAAPRPPRDRADEIETLTEVTELYAEMVQRLQTRTPQASGHNPRNLMS